jgi:RNA polymerase sigma factor (sigma-70 family)
MSRFETTDWAVVFESSSAGAPGARSALASLCEAYWYPIYAFIRSQGYLAPDAEDLTQAYFVRFLEKDYLKGLRPEHGRFRAFILASVKHFLANERDRARALKRGGAHRLISLDSQDAEERYRHEPAHAVTPEAVFERSWARTVLDAAMDRLQAEAGGPEGRRRFERLKGHILDEGSDTGYEAAAHELGLSAGAVRVAVHRLRRRFGEVLREAITRTVSDPRETEDEIRHLLELRRS